MSSLSQFAPFAGGGLKSFQTGYVQTDTATQTSAGEDWSYVDVSISSVSTTKSIPNAFGSFGPSAGSRGYYFASTSNQYGIVLPRLTSSTNLRLSQSGAGVYLQSSLAARWQVAEAN
jgi:hypothetical protein